MLGGTFSPPHNGHLEMAKAVLNQFDIDEVVFIPCGDPPHKSGDSVWKASHRFEMTKILIENQKNMSVSDVEINSQGKSFTALTLSKLSEQNKDTKFYFIVGADSLCYMDDWRMPEVIFEKAEIIFVGRKGFSTEKVDDYISFLEEKYNAVIHRAFMENVDISSSFLREKLKQGKDISKYTGDRVYQYILENKNDF